MKELQSQTSQYIFSRWMGFITRIFSNGNTFMNTDFSTKLSRAANIKHPKHVENNKNCVRDLRLLWQDSAVPQVMTHLKIIHFFSFSRIFLFKIGCLDEPNKKFAVNSDGCFLSCRAEGGGALREGLAGVRLRVAGGTASPLASLREALRTFTHSSIFQIYSKLELRN